MKEFYVVVTKECYARINARSEAEAIDIGHDLLDPSNYDDEIIVSVRCLDEVDDDLDFREELSEAYYDDMFRKLECMEDYD